MAKHGNAAVLKNKIYELRRATRDDEIDLAFHRQDLHHFGPVFEGTDGVAQRSAERRQRVMPYGDQNAVSMPGFCAAFQHQSIAGLDGKRANLRNSIWPRLKNHGNHA